MNVLVSRPIPLIAFAFSALSLPALAQTVFTVNTTIAAGDVTYENQDITVRGCTVTINGVHTFRSLTIERSAGNAAGVVTHTAASTAGGVNGVSLTITNDCTIQGPSGGLVASRIDLNGRGHPSSTGPGEGADSFSDSAGAGHGGTGGASNNVSGGAPYGSIVGPVLFGSGGGDSSAAAGSGGAGGGCLRLSIGGTLTVNGSIVSDGVVGGAPNWAAGGGSGGSVWITCGTLAGGGIISALGGAGGDWGSGSGPSGGGGAGGRVAVFYSTNTFSGTMSACGGVGFRAGGAGTVWAVRSGDPSSDMTIDNCGRLAPVRTVLSGLTIRDLTVRAGAGATVTQTAALRGVTLRDNSSCTLTPGTGANGPITLDSTGTLSLSRVQSVQSLLVLRGVLTHEPGEPQGLDMSVSGAATIAAGALIDVSAKGHPSSTGPGEGSDSQFDAAGAGHAGTGGQGSPSGAGGTAYGSIVAPDQLGSGGGSGNSTAGNGGRGGGRIRLNVAGTLTNSGAIRANGGTGLVPSWAGGGGSGGSIYLISGTLAGSGVIQALGGDGGQWTGAPTGGGGSGGRVALASASDSFTGTISVCGGVGGQNGAVGTIYRSIGGVPVSDMTLDNCGRATTAATVISGLAVRDLTAQNGGSIVISQAQPLRNVSVLGSRAVVVPGTLATGALTLNDAPSFAMDGPQSLGAVSIQGVSTAATLAGEFDVTSFTMSAGSLTHRAADERGLAILSSGDVTIGAAATITASGRGFASSDGPGQGSDSAFDAAGAGYGGIGGRATSGTATPGGVYGAPDRPELLGSGGGDWLGLPGSGGEGGGYIRIDTPVTLTLNGLIAANGSTGRTPNWAAGGGSGGSVWLSAGSFTGTGQVTSNGASGGSWSGQLNGGAGGGGRIAIYSCNVTVPIGNIRAVRGAGAGTAGNGTVHFGSGSVQITEQPVGGDYRGGDFFQMHVAATGQGALSYQWRKRNDSGVFVPIPEGFDNVYFNVDSDTLFVQGIGCSGSGTYDCLVCDSCGCFPSNNATLIIAAPGDFNHDGGIDGGDVEAFFAAWENGEAEGDINQDGGIDGSDVDFFFLRWEQGC